MQSEAKRIETLEFFRGGVGAWKELDYLRQMEQRKLRMAVLGGNGLHVVIRPGL
jgi:hypothetical protein